LSVQDYFELNRAAWDRRVGVHLQSKFYDVEGFLSGRTSLREIELQELEVVAGQRLLHLQCHFGLDTLSWARRRAICTGVDISPVAIQQARRLSRESRVEAEFVCANVCEFDRGAVDPFDIVFTSYGAVCWLPDIRQWAGIVASNLAPGGTFYMVEFHPIYDLLAGYTYFTSVTPDLEEEGSYTENAGEEVNRVAVWVHPVSSVINALIDAGIRIERLNEFPYSPYNCFEGMEEREPGRFYLQHEGHDVPLVYSILGRKET